MAVKEVGNTLSIECRKKAIMRKIRGKGQGPEASLLASYVKHKIPQ